MTAKNPRDYRVLNEVLALEQHVRRRKWSCNGAIVMKATNGTAETVW